jgi:hypothetical protein
LAVRWAAVGFLMMGFGLICLLIAERRKKQSTKKQSFARLIAGESRDHWQAAEKPDYEGDFLDVCEANNRSDGSQPALDGRYWLRLCLIFDTPDGLIPLRPEALGYE